MAINFSPPIGARLNWSHPICRGLMSYWPINEGGGRIIKDIAGTSDGTALNNPAWKPGLFGQSLDLNGTTQSISTGIALPSKGTVSLWAYHNRLYTNGVADGLGGGITSGSELQMLRFSDGNSYYGYFNGGSRISIASSPANWPFQLWTHYVLTWENGGNLVLYINGSFVASTTNPLISGAFYIGQNFEGFHSGPMNNVRVYNRAISAQEARQLYAQPSAGILAPSRYFYALLGGGIFSFPWSDSSVSSETIATAMRAFAAPSDTTATGDSSSGAMLAAGTVADTAASSDTQASRTVAAPSDSAVTSDSASGAMLATGSTPDTAASSDTQAGAMRAFGAPSDSAASTDTTTGAGQATAAPGDSAATSDATTGVGRSTASLADTAATSDSVTGFMLATALLADSAALSDLFSVLAAGSFFFTLSDTAATSDTAVSTARMAATVIDAVVSSDALPSTAVMAGATSDAGSSADAISGQALSNRTLADIVATSESIASVAPAFVTALSDAIASSDLLAFSGIVLLLRPIIAAMLAGPILRIVRIDAVSRIASASGIARIVQGLP